MKQFYVEPYVIKPTTKDVLHYGRKGMKWGETMAEVAANIILPGSTQAMRAAKSDITRSKASKAASVSERGRVRRSEENKRRDPTNIVGGTYGDTRRVAAAQNSHKSEQLVAEKAAAAIADKGEKLLALMGKSEDPDVFINTLSNEDKNILLGTLVKLHMAAK